ncbi:retinol dehydrogenase 8-like [Amphiura filiformis]|uniref:retinol dehydrogenase 8-like n=1 Tax=Amphiura filiformis TaxID=82378 RepID=UPI003B21AAF4
MASPVASSLVILITGCAQGIGKETALFLARDPQRRFKVYATMRNMATRQEELKTEATNILDDTLFIRELDVTKQQTIDKTVKEIIDIEGKMDILVNNAGILNTVWWETGPMETFYEVMEVNYFGCVRMTRAVVPYMKEKRNGRILQISSVNGFHGIPICASYTASKFALLGFSESIAPPLRKFNIWVSVIEPGYVATDMVKQFGDNPTDAFEKAAGLIIPGEEERKIVTNMLTSDPEIVAGNNMLAPQDLAKQLQDVILSPKPDFRYQTSKAIKRLAREKFVDPTGNAIMNAWLKQ